LERLMAGDKARMVFTDPPYNVRIDGHVGNSGRIQQALLRKCHEGFTS
jgi:16S rRNA G966 N2-methylase RsmD